MPTIFADNTKFVSFNLNIWFQIANLRINVYIASNKINTFIFRQKTLITPPARRAWRCYKFAPFLFFFPCRKSAHRSWVTPLCIVWATTLNSISSGICHQNTQFNMYTTTSKQQEGCTFEDSHPKCFITTNSTAKLSRGAVNAVMYMFWERHIQRSIRIQFVIILILFDTTDYRCYMVIIRYRSVCVQRK